MRGRPYEFRSSRHRVTGAGFPHSEIFGSKRACRSPKLIAACCVLHRLMKPRHPSIAVTGSCKRFPYSRRLFYPLTTYTTLDFQRTKVFLIRRPPGPSDTLCTQCKMVGPDGLEPSTPRLSSACSNQLSYEPKMENGADPRGALVEPTGFEPVTPCLQSRCSTN